MAQASLSQIFYPVISFSFDEIAVENSTTNNGNKKEEEERNDGRENFEQ